MKKTAYVSKSKKYIFLYFCNNEITKKYTGEIKGGDEIIPPVVPEEEDDFILEDLIDM